MSAHQIDFTLDVALPLFLGGSILACAAGVAWCGYQFMQPTFGAQCKAAGGVPITDDFGDRHCVKFSSMWRVGSDA